MCSSLKMLILSCRLEPLLKADLTTGHLLHPFQMLIDDVTFCIVIWGSSNKQIVIVTCKRYLIVFVLSLIKQREASLWIRGISTKFGSCLSILACIAVRPKLSKSNWIRLYFASSGLLNWQTILTTNKIHTVKYKFYKKWYNGHLCWETYIKC